MATVSEGVVFAWSCTACRDRLGITGGTEYAPGRWNLGPMHIGHVPELVALGWQSRCTHRQLCLASAERDTGQ